MSNTTFVIVFSAMIMNKRGGGVVALLGRGTCSAPQRAGMSQLGHGSLGTESQLSLVKLPSSASLLVSGFGKMAVLRGGRGSPLLQTCSACQSKIAQNQRNVRVIR